MKEITNHEQYNIHIKLISYEKAYVRVFKKNIIKGQKVRLVLFKIHIIFNYDQI